MRELNYKESWAPKNWYFWTVVLEKTLESPLDCKEIKPVNPEYSLEGLMLKLKLQYVGHFIWRADSLGKTLMLAKTEGRRRGWQRLRWLMVSFTQWVWVSVSSRRCWMTGKPGMLQSMGSQRVRHNWVTEQQQQTQMDFTWTKPPSPCFPLFINFHFLAAAQCPTFLLSLSQLFYSLIQSPLHKLKLNSFIKEPLPYCDGLLLIKACPYHFN